MPADVVVRPWGPTRLPLAMPLHEAQIRDARVRLRSPAAFMHPRQQPRWSFEPWLIEPDQPYHRRARGWSPVTVWGPPLPRQEQGAALLGDRAAFAARQPDPTDGAPTWVPGGVPLTEEGMPLLGGDVTGPAAVAVGEAREAFVAAVAVAPTAWVPAVPRVWGMERGRPPGGVHLGFDPDVADAGVRPWTVGRPSAAAAARTRRVEVPEPEVEVRPRPLAAFGVPGTERFPPYASPRPWLEDLWPHRPELVEAFEAVEAALRRALGQPARQAVDAVAAPLVMVKGGPWYGDRTPPLAPFVPAEPAWVPADLDLFGLDAPADPADA